MNEQAFVERREEDWRRLQTLTDKGDATVRALTGEELREMVRLYRRVSTDLALVRTKSTNQGLVEFLNDVVARAYSVLYRSPRPPFWRTIVNVLALAAQTVRRRRWFVITSMAIFLFSAIFSYFVLDAVPGTRDVLVPAEAEELFKGWKSGQFEARSGSESAMMSGFYASNNPRVAIIAGAVGAGSFGFLSVLMNYQNGALIGVLAHEVDQVGNLDFLLSSIIPHGVPEISGLWVSCSAGLLLGWALINPGRRSRGDALKAVGKDAVVLLAVSVVLMFIAAPIEGFFSFNPAVPGGVKVLVAAVEVVAWVAFWGFFGRDPEAETPA
jgi:uncharacterized membrane protein SpoIIM required for sporulation